jgi:hypothetical protein
MGALKAVGIDAIMKRGSIKDIDVLELRKAFYHDSSITADEAQLLFSVHRSSPVQDASWALFFSEAIVDFIVNQAQPEGYVTSDNAAWLIARCATNGAVNSRLEFEVLVQVLERARWSPASLVSFALEQIRVAVTEGVGPLRIDGVISKNHITTADISLLRRIVFAFGGDGNVAITRSEAEILFAINDAVDGSEPNPEWADFFVKAIANSVMAASGYAVPSRDEALKEGEWLDRRGDLSPLAMVRSIASASLHQIIDLYSEQSAEERALARLERQRIEIITNEQITEGEASWLAERLSHQGALSNNERALVDFINREAPNVHPALKDAVAKLCAAA